MKVKKLAWQSIAMIVVLLAAVVLVVGILSNHMKQSQAREEIEKYEQMIQQQTDENAELKDVINSGDIQEYAAGIARDQLGYGESDEKVYVNITGK